MVLGVGNGLSSGILLTLGADVAPRDDPAPFLGSWRTLTDAGGAITPLIVSGLTAAFSLALATGLRRRRRPPRRRRLRALGAACSCLAPDPGQRTRPDDGRVES